MQRVIRQIVQNMQTKVGTPEDARIRERKWHERLSEIEERLKSFQTPPRFKTLSSPENTQVGEDYMILLGILQTLVCVLLRRCGMLLSNQGLATT